MRKRITNNLALKILAFLIAAFLWLVVVNIDDPVDDKTFSNIPVQVTHEEVITDNNNTYQIVDNTQEINVTVTAQRSVLDKIRTEDIVATANMKELTLRTQVPIEVTVKGYTGKYEKATANPRNLQSAFWYMWAKYFPKSGAKRLEPMNEFSKSSRVE